MWWNKFSFLCNEGVWWVRTFIYNLSKKIRDAFSCKDTLDGYLTRNKKRKPS